MSVYREITETIETKKANGDPLPQAIIVNRSEWDDLVDACAAFLDTPPIAGDPLYVLRVHGVEIHCTEKAT